MVDEVYELLNIKQTFDSRPGWERLGHRLRIKNLEDFAPREAQRTSPTHALMNHLEGAQPSLTLERFICGLYQINRNDVVEDVIRPYLPGVYDQQRVTAYLFNSLKTKQMFRCREKLGTTVICLEESVATFLIIFIQSRVDSVDDVRSDCRNVSHCLQQHSFSALLSPGRSNYTNKIASVDKNFIKIVKTQKSNVRKLSTISFIKST